MSFQTLCDDDKNNEIDENWDDYSSEIDESSRAFKSKKSVSLKKSRMSFWKNKLEMTDKNSLKKKRLEL